MTTTPSPPVATSRQIGRILGRAVLAGITVVSFAACSSGAANTPPPAATAEPETVSPSPSNTATATVGPGRTTMVVDGDFPDIPIEFTLPTGWELTNGWVAKTDNYGWPEGSGGPPFGFVFMVVANIYADGCRWQAIDPPPGPSVDDLAAAYTELPGFGGTGQITVGGFSGKLVNFTVPAYEPGECREGVFALFSEDEAALGDPTVLAQHPNQRNKIWILDVRGTRLVIHTSYPPKTSAEDRAEIDTIISSMQIG